LALFVCGIRRTTKTCEPATADQLARIIPDDF
jgi:hypothetical protein